MRTEPNNMVMGRKCDLYAWWWMPPTPKKSYES